MAADQTDLDRADYLGKVAGRSPVDLPRTPPNRTRRHVPTVVQEVGRSRLAPQEALSPPEAPLWRTWSSPTLGTTPLERQERSEDSRACD